MGEKRKEREKKGGEREKKRGRNSVILCFISKEMFIVPQFNMRTGLVHNKAL